MFRLRRWCAGPRRKLIEIVAGMLLIFLSAFLARPLVAQRGGDVHQDPTGDWVQTGTEDRMEHGGGPEIGDYLGVPINEAARYAADAWNADIVSTPENVCKGHSADHSWREGLPAGRIWAEVDQNQKVVAYHTFLQLMGPEETFYMDGRPHPPWYAPYTWQGFSTGKWEGDILAVTTDHMKNNLLKWTGIPRSEKAVLNRHFMRHEDYLTMVQVIYDPAYLTEPWILSLDYVNRPGINLTAYRCEEWDSGDVPQGFVPSRMPGTNEFLNEFPARHGIPPKATRGGAETMYPEYIVKMKTMKKLPRIPNPFTNFNGSVN